MPSKRVEVEDGKRSAPELARATAHPSRSNFWFRISQSTRAALEIR